MSPYVCQHNIAESALRPPFCANSWSAGRCCPTWANSGRHRPDLAVSGPNLVARSRRSFSELDKLWHTFGQFGATSTKSGSISATNRRNWPSLVTKLGRPRPIWCDFGARVRSKHARCGPAAGDCGRRTKRRLPANLSAIGNIPPATVATARCSTGAQSSANALIMPVITHYGEHFNDNCGHGEKLLLYSSAECCTCPKDCAADCPLGQLPEGGTPKLVTVAGHTVNVYGSKRVHYTCPKG